MADAFTHQHQYSIRKNDFILMIYEDESPVFTGQIQDIPVQHCPKEPSGLKLTFIGEHQHNQIVISAARINSKENISESIRKTVFQAMNEAKKYECARVVIPVHRKYHNFARDIQAAAVLGGYVYDKYLHKKESQVPVTVISSEKLNAAQLKQDRVLWEWTLFARTILNESSSKRKPEHVAASFIRAGKKAGVKTTFWNMKELKKQKCGGIIAVGSGSDAPPCMVIGEYRPKKAKTHLALVGKGVTFDTGGYCLKPADAQTGMKLDMSGAAVVWAVICAAAEQKLPIRITAVCPLVENCISGHAMHVGDILEMRSGKTVEVVNTDAEGRLILADALDYAAQQKPDAIVDAATLTGACLVALGEDIAGVLSSDKHLEQQIIKAGEMACEQIWALPLHKSYDEQLKSGIADMKNCGSRYGGTITSALFLKRFVPDSIPWAHLDIAGPAMKEGIGGWMGNGAKAFGTETLYRLAELMLKQK